VSAVVYRVELAKFADAAREGRGAYLAGGRWNSPGHEAVYCAGSLSLGILEILAHLTPKTRANPRVYFAVTLAEHAVEVLLRDTLPASFGSETDPAITQRLGDAWLRSCSSVTLQVPSAIVPGEFNFILNPKHPDYPGAVEWSAPAALTLDRCIVAAPLAPGSTRRKGR
jgi:RES domain-containing protein